MSHDNKAMPFINELGDAMRRNPVSTALIGMGVLWLFTGGKSGERISRLAQSAGLDRVPDVASNLVDAGRTRMHDVQDRISDGLTDVGAKASGLVSAVRETGTQALDRVSDVGRDIPGRSTELFGAARSQLGELFEDQPLLLGAIGVAIGAGIAASLPATEVEADLFGETSDDLKNQAREFVSHANERVGAAARDAVSAATEEARRQGLTPEGVMKAVGEVGDKAKRIVSAAEDNLRLE